MRVRGPSGPPSAIPDDPIKSSTYLAEQMTGISRSKLSLTQTPLRVTKKKKVHRFDFQADDKLHRPLSIVHKTSDSYREFRIYRHLARNPAWLPSSIAPRVYSSIKQPIHSGEHHYSFLLEHVLCGLPDRSEATAQQLAEKIGILSTLSTREASWIKHSPYELSPALLEKFTAIAVERNQLVPELDGLTRNWCRISSIHDHRLRIVPCHNDINLKNIAMRRSGKQTELLFLDWEQFGLNYLGSDMHHLMRASISKPRFTPFFNQLYSRYKALVCEKHRVKESEIDLAALTYTLYRCMWRTVRTEGCVLQTKEVGVLYSRLKRLGSLPCISEFCEALIIIVEGPVGSAGRHATIV